MPLLFTKTEPQITVHVEPRPLIMSEIWKHRLCPPSQGIIVKSVKYCYEEINVFELELEYSLLLSTESIYW